MRCEQDGLITEPQYEKQSRWKGVHRLCSDCGVILKDVCGLEISARPRVTPSSPACLPPLCGHRPGGFQVKAAAGPISRVTQPTLPTMKRKARMTTPSFSSSAFSCVSYFWLTCTTCISSGTLRGKAERQSDVNPRKRAG